MQRVTRLVAAGLAGVLVLTACSSDDPDLPSVPVGTGTDAPAPDATGTTSETPSADPSPTGATVLPPDSPTSEDPTEPPPAESEPTTAPTRTAANDAGGVGVNGRAMLRGDRPVLVIEIDVQEGVSVDQAAVDHMVAEVSRHVDKPGGITFAGGNTFASDRDGWTTDDLRAAAAQHRSTATTDDQVSVHVLYVAGGHMDGGEQTSAIGLAYSASNVALFPQRWSGLGGLLGSERQTERAVLVHEMGHLFGLVNIGYQSEIDHEDPEHPGHSSNDGSVMFHAIESTLIGQVFQGSPPDRFDDADAADLAGLRDGRL